jgi:hypothetical protein
LKRFSSFRLSSKVKFDMMLSAWDRLYPEACESKAPERQVADV